MLAYNTPGNKLGDSGYPENRTPVAATTTDVDARWLTALSEIAVGTGIAAEYDVDDWGHTLDVTISSLLPGDARELAQMLCQEARARDVDSGWTSAGVSAHGRRLGRLQRARREKAGRVLRTSAPGP